ncbi:hypothetical protein DID80_03800 [Candidatus Marinamargulisbacteria bacterium SCGC AAA071-K20]|nr:hypothetical protein DID80_03800 [Candidatus Marinamargulisbacteria bacterium SCGC AAA071-K20]
MSSIFFYSSPTLYSPDSLFWKSIVDLINYKLPPLCIVPSADYKKGIIQFLSTHFLLTQFPNIVTLEELLLESLGKSVDSKPETQTMLLHSVLNSLSLPVLDSIKHTPGFRRHFFKFLNTVEENRLRRQDFLVKHLERDTALINDIWDIKDSFEALQKKQCPTWFTHYKQSLPHFNQLTQTLKSKSVFILGFSTLLPFQKNLFKTILSSSLSCSVYESANSIKDWLNESEIDFQNVIDSPIQRVGNPLFYNTESCELEWVIKDIKCRVDKGAPQTDFAIVCAKSFADSDIRKISHLATLFCLDIDSDRPQSLLQSSPSQLALQCCALALNGFLRAEVKALFLCPHVERFKYSDQLLILDMDLIQNIAANASVLESAQHWISQLKVLEPSLCRLDPDSEKITSIKNHILFFTLLDQELQLLKRAQDTIGFSKQLKNILDLFQLKPLFLKQNEHASFSAVTSYYSFTDALKRFSTDYDSLFKLFRFDHAFSQFKLFLSGIYYQIPKPATIGISLCSLNQALARNIPQLYVVNTIEGVWPEPVNSSLFVPESIQKRLIHHHSKSLRTALKLLLTSASTSCKSLTFTYSDEDSKKSMPSSVFQEFSRENFNQPASFVEPPNHHIHHQIDIQKHEGLSEGSPKKDMGLSQQNRQYFNERLSNHSFSATELDTYNQCPRQHFFAYGLKLRDQREWIDEVKGSLWGTLIHDIFYQFFMTLKKNDSPYMPDAFSDPNSDPSQLLFAIARRVFKSYSQDSFYWNIKEEALFGSPSKPGLLQLFMKDEHNSPLQGTPDTFEMAFDDVLAESVKIKGKIDMILKLSNGAMSVVDFKTGAALPSIADIKEKRSLQLPLYMLALHNKGYRVDSAYFYHMKDQKRFGKKMMAVSKQAKDDGLKTGRSRPYAFSESYFEELTLTISTLKQMMSDGKFSYEPYEELSHLTSKRQSTCKYCAYSDACSYDGRFSA